VEALRMGRISTDADEEGEDIPLGGDAVL
jgi:hypothetical protein